MTLAATIAFTLPDLAAAVPGPLLTLADAGGNEVARLEVRAAGSDPALRAWDDLRQNYLRWAGPDGTAAVLEAVVAIQVVTGAHPHLPSQARVGVPLALLAAGGHALHLRISPGKVELVIDGKLIDEEWPCGGLPALPLAGGGARVWPRALRDAELGLQAEDGIAAGQVAGHDAQYWTPPGHNRWVGDTMMFQDGERLHLMYLLDRRQHGSKSGAGASQIAHLSTTDLRTWEVHPLAVASVEPWEVIGTGGITRHAGMWYVFYGLHTDRVLTRPLVDHGQHTPLPSPFDRLNGPPQGAAYAVSDDGVHFRKAGVLVHAAQNPSVFAHPDGGLALFAGYGAEGLFHADDGQHWRLVDQGIIPHGAGAPQRNSTECICHLEWNGWNYLFGGRTGFWMSRAYAGPYWDRDGATTVATPRWDIYDGLWVPMAAALADGRRILSGWLEDRGGWAGCLVLRELLQEDDGTLAMRWPVEALPALAPVREPAWDAGAWPRRLAAVDAPVWAVADGLPDEFLLEVTVTSATGAGPYSLVVGGTGDLADGCELRLDPGRGTAQWGTPAAGRPAATVPTQAEIFATADGLRPIFQQTSPHLPFHGRDFAITGVTGLDHAVTIRLLVVRDRKSGSTIVDAEIGGRRTMISRRHGLVGTRLHVVATAGTVTVERPVIRPLQRGG